MADQLTLVRKLDYQERETWRWTGQLVERRENRLVVDAIFNARPRDLGYMKLESSDLFHEFYYSDRWFNIFQVFEADGVLKGWYCNVCKPARFSDAEISFVDMVLDVFVHPDGRTLVLDEEEFAQNRTALYAPEDADHAQAAVAELLGMVQRREAPFDGIRDHEERKQDKQD